MKHYRIITYACILGSLVLLAGCKKDGFGSGSGRVIRFGASLNSTVQTRAAYSGEGELSDGALTWERIEWNENDKIRIASNLAYIQDGGDGGLQPGLHYADYSIGAISNNGKISTTNLAPLTDKSNGLVWDDDSQGSNYAFYAVTPCPFYDPYKTWLEIGSGDDETTLGLVKTLVPSAQKFITEGTITRYVDANGKVGSGTTLYTTEQEGGITYTVYPVDPDYTVLTAATTGVSYKKNDVPMDFIPAYTAFEFHVTTQDESLKVKKIALVSTGTDYLAGTYTLMAGTVNATLAEDAKTEDNQTVSMDLGDGLDLTQDKGVALTLRTVPVKNEKALTLQITDDEGSTASLALTYGGNADGHNAGDPYQFDPGKKYRINLLKVGAKWRFTITPVANEWNLEEIETSFANQIQSSRFSITGDRENGSNNYVAFGDDTDYFQQRTLDTNNGAEFFEVTFTPTAPRGGYWMLQPNVSDEAFRIVVWDAKAYEDDEEYTGNPDLWGPIMNTPVTLRIYPYPSLDDLDRTYAHTLYFHAIFATDRDFETSFNADSEIQDAHADGTFSYWYFVIPAQ